MDFRVDPTLIERARSNDDALNELLRQIWPEVFRVAVGIVRDRASAEDAAQEACASIAHSLNALKDCAAFYGWMYRIAGRCAIRGARAYRRHPVEPIIEDETSEDSETRIDLRDAILHLPLAQRAAIVLQYFAGLSSAEVAAILGVPSPTVRFHSMLARRALRKMLGTEVHNGQERCADA